MGGGGGNTGNPPVINASAPPAPVPPFGQIGNNPQTASQLGQGTPTKAGSQGQLPVLDTTFNAPVSGTPVFPNSASFPQPPVYGFGMQPSAMIAAAAPGTPAPAAPAAPAPAAPPDQRVGGEGH